MLDAAIKHQSSTSQRDICHCTAHFVRSALPQAFEVHIRIIKTGRGFTNLSASLMQDGNVRIMTHLIFTTLPETPIGKAKQKLPSPEDLTVIHPSPHARVMPIETSPNQCQDSPNYQKFTFRHKMRWSEQWDQTNRRNAQRQSDGTGGAEWQGWVTLADPSDSITSASL